jgi:hypothetical protein
MITIVPCRLREAREFVANFHRHNAVPQGGLFAVGASDGEQLVGVAITGLPVARGMMDGMTLEVTRCCVVDDAPKGACSALYAACWRAAKAMGYARLVTYTLQSEGGASLRGAGWRVIAERAARDPAQWLNRPGREWQTIVGQAKFLWQAV